MMTLGLKTEGANVEAGTAKFADTTNRSKSRGSVLHGRKFCFW